MTVVENHPYSKAVFMSFILDGKRKTIKATTDKNELIAGYIVNKDGSVKEVETSGGTTKEFVLVHRTDIQKIRYLRLNLRYEALEEVA